MRVGAGAQPDDQSGRTDASSVTRSVGPLPDLYLGDALAVLKTLPSRSVDVVVTGPPWWGRWWLTDAEPMVWGGMPGHEHDWTPSKPWKAPDSKEVDTGAYCNCMAWKGHLAREPGPTLYAQHLMWIFEEVKRVLTGEGVMYLTIGDARHPEDRSQWSGCPSIVLHELKRAGWRYINEVIWERPNTRPGTRTHEYMFVLGKTHTKPPKIERTIWRIGARHVRETHFEGLPDELIQRCIELSAPEGGTVMDPFAGSGNVLSVARRNGMKGIGIEIAPQYYEIAKGRLGL